MRERDKKLKLARLTGRYGDWNILRTLRQVVKSDPQRRTRIFSEWNILKRGKRVVNLEGHLPMSVIFQMSQSYLKTLQTALRKRTFQFFKGFEKLLG